MNVPTEEVTLWEGNPSIKAWSGTFLLGVATSILVVGLFILLNLKIRSLSQKWKITNRRIELESGFLSKQVRVVEIWRVQDVRLEQNLFERLFGMSRILITAHDQDTPMAAIPGVLDGRKVYDRLMEAVLASRAQRGVLNLNP